MPDRFHCKMLCLLLLLPAAVLHAQQDLQSQVVYYQVTYNTGEVRDLFSPPPSDEGIASVVRIARLDAPIPKHTMVSTEVGVVVYNQPRVYRNDMKYNGKGWVLAHEPSGQAVDAEKELAKALLEESRRILTEKTQAREQLEEARASRKDFQILRKETRSAEALKALERQEKQLDQRIEALQEQMEHLDKASEAFDDQAQRLLEPIGKVSSPEGLAAPHGGWGVAKPLAVRKVRPYRMQLWPLPPGKGQRSYRVSMAHTAGGLLGSFCYVVYADTDNDGRPDKMLGASPLVVCESPGQWSTWTFQASHDRLFVGNTWPDARASVYAGHLGKDSSGRGRNWHGLGGQVWVSGFFGGVPERTFAPYITNLRVELVAPDE
jgi:hypothetical protein